MDFSKALVLIKTGHMLTRRGWNGQGMHVAIQRPDENSANTRPYIYIVPVGGGRVPWVASHGDIMAEDWAIVPV